MGFPLRAMLMLPETPACVTQSATDPFAGAKPPPPRTGWLEEPWPSGRGFPIPRADTYAA